MFRAPNQRLLSAFYFDCHIDLQELRHPDGTWFFQDYISGSLRRMLSLQMYSSYSITTTSSQVLVTQIIQIGSFEQTIVRQSRSTPRLSQPEPRNILLELLGLGAALHACSMDAVARPVRWCTILAPATTVLQRTSFQAHQWNLNSRWCADGTMRWWTKHTRGRQLPRYEKNCVCVFFCFFASLSLLPTIAICQITFGSCS